MLFLSVFCFALYTISTALSLVSNVKNNMPAGTIIVSIILQALILYCLFSLVILLI